MQHEENNVLDQDQYNAFASSSPQGTLFCSSWWLDAVAPDSYRILTVQQGETIQAAWPVVFKRSRFGGVSIVTPPLTPWLGVLYRPSSAKLAKQLSEQKRVCARLIEQLGKFDTLDARFHRNFAYWSPFYWRGFSQTARYTYVLEDLTDMDAVWSGLRQNIRTDIRKAQRKGITVKGVDDIEEFWRIHALTFGRQHMQVPYSLDFLRRLDRACKLRGVRRIFVAQDETGDVHAAAFIVWDQKSAYYLMGGADPDKRSSGANSLMIWQAIRFASTVTNAFDFEGSMIESVERFFRAYGARPYPYSVISKVNSPLHLIYRKAHHIARSVRKRQ